MTGLESVAKRTVLRPGAVDDYLDLHRRPPGEVLDALRAAGVHDWRIWVSGADLFHVIDVESRVRMRDRLRGDPVMAEWSRRVGPLLLPTSQHEADLARVWSLREQAGEGPAGDPAT